MANYLQAKSFGYKANIDVGLYKWRLNLGSAKADFENATNLAKQCVGPYLRGLRKFGLELEEANYFPFGRATLFSGLIQDSFDQTLLKALPRLDHWKDLVAPNMVDYYDAALVQFIRKRKSRRNSMNSLRN